MASFSFTNWHSEKVADFEVVPATFERVGTEFDSGKNLLHGHFRSIASMAAGLPAFVVIELLFKFLPFQQHSLNLILSFNL